MSKSTRRHYDFNKDKNNLSEPRTPSARPARRATHRAGSSWSEKMRARLFPEQRKPKRSRVAKRTTT